jgi:hypothetical protein
VNPMSNTAMNDGAKQLLAKIIGDGKLFDEPRRTEEKSDYQRPEKRPGPFAQDRSRTPPTKEQRDKDYKPEKDFVGKVFKGRP